MGFKNANEKSKVTQRETTKKTYWIEGGPNSYFFFINETANVCADYKLNIIVLKISKTV